MRKADAVILAAGKGTRMQCDENKIFLPLCGRPILARSVDAFRACGLIHRIVVVGAAAELPRLREILGDDVILVPGGELRRDSVLNGLQACNAEIVAIHDGARPLVSAEVIARSIASAAEKGSGIAAVPAKDTVKTVDEQGMILHTPPRDRVWCMQTPQSFRRELILEAYLSVPDRDVTDDASVLERHGHPVYITMGSHENMKITTPEDLVLGAALIKE